MTSLHHLALRVADPARSAKFYVEVLGLVELARYFGEEAEDGAEDGVVDGGEDGVVDGAEDGAPRAVWLALGEAVLMLERSLLPPGPAAGSAHVLVLMVEAPDDLEVWAGRLAAAGVEVVERTGFTLYVHDPDGHRLGLSTFRFAQD